MVQQAEVVGAGRRPDARFVTRVVGATLLAFALVSRPLLGQASVYVPTSDPAYYDLDLLLASGLVREAIVGERPHSRAAFARFLSEAQARLSGGTWDARYREALDRLRLRFADGDNRPVGATADLESLRVEATLARSPDRPLRSGDPGSFIDGNVNPLLQRNEGRFFEDGAATSFEADLVVQRGIVAGAVVPRLVAGVASDGDTYADATLQAAYGRMLLGTFALDLGRSHARPGYGSRGGVMLTDNARGLDMVRISADRPVRLPSAFGALGAWQPSVSVVYMGENRDIPGSVMTMMRLSGRPSRFVEFAFHYFNLQGGEGSPEASLRERLHDLLFFATENGGWWLISDKVAGVDLRVSAPAARSALYASFSTTDARGNFSQPAGGVWEDAVWLVGAEAMGIGPGARFDVRVEWRHAGPEAHTHGQFTSGQTLDGRVLGDALGPNAAGVSAQLAWTDARARLQVGYDWERYSGDDYQLARIPGGGEWDYDWYRIADGPDEIRHRISAEYSRFATRGLESSVRLGYERVTRFGFSDENRSNVLAGVVLHYAW
jgi:hypothetical protein